MPKEARARQAAIHFLDRMATSAAPSVPDDINRSFRAETGMTFARWCHSARMRVARQLLAHDLKPSAVARRVG